MLETMEKRARLAGPRYVLPPGSSGKKSGGKSGRPNEEAMNEYIEARAQEIGEERAKEMLEEERRKRGVMHLKGES